MIAIDTNLLVRFLTRDDPRRGALAARRIESGTFVSHGVLMEAEWLLRRSYGWDRRQINVALTEFLALEQVEVELPDGVFWALDQHRVGADWADMLHLIAARRRSGLVTLEEKLAVRSDGSPVEVELLA